MKQLRELWRYDLVRQSAIAFGFGFLAAGLIVVVLVAATPLFRGGVSSVDEETAKISGEARGAYLAERQARRDAQLLGPQAAERDLAGLLAEGTRGEGYELAYRRAWNDAVTQLSWRLPRQMLAREEHTQWIELLR